MIEIKPEAKKTDGITNDLVEITRPSIEKMIYVIRDKQVMLDSDLAILYRVETGALNRAVKRNISRFPEDFRFQLTKEEYQNLRCQTGIQVLRRAKIIMVVVGLFLMYLQNRESLCWLVFYIAKWQLR